MERDLSVGMEGEVLQLTVQVVLVTVPDFFPSKPGIVAPGMCGHVKRYSACSFIGFS